MGYEWQKDNLLTPLLTIFVMIPIFLTVMMIPLGLIGAVVEFVTPFKAFTLLLTLYKTGFSFFMEHSLVIITLIGVAWFSKNNMFYYRTLEVIRRSEFEAELKRYANTPYVPYLLLQYLLNPPAGLYTHKDAEFEKKYTFYRHLVSFFRSQVYQSKSGKPVGPKYSYLSVVKSNVIMIGISLAISIAAILIVHYKFGLTEFLFNSYGGFGIFAFIPWYVLTGWGLSQLFAVMRYPKYSYIFAKNAEDELSDLLWEEVLPGTYYSEWLDDVNREYRRNIAELYGDDAAKALPCYPQDLYPPEMPKHIYYPVPGTENTIANVGTTTWNEKEAKVLHKEKPFSKKNEEKTNEFQKPKEKKTATKNKTNVVSFVDFAKSNKNR